MSNQTKSKLNCKAWFRSPNHQITPKARVNKTQIPLFSPSQSTEDPCSCGPGGTGSPPLTSTPPNTCQSSTSEDPGSVLDAEQIIRKLEDRRQSSLDHHWPVPRSYVLEQQHALSQERKFHFLSKFSPSLRNQWALGLSKKNNRILQTKNKTKNLFFFFLYGPRNGCSYR